MIPHYRRNHGYNPEPLYKLPEGHEHLTADSICLGVYVRSKGRNIQFDSVANRLTSAGVLEGFLTELLYDETGNLFLYAITDEFGNTHRFEDTADQLAEEFFCNVSKSRAGIIDALLADSLPDPS